MAMAAGGMPAVIVLGVLPVIEIVADQVPDMDSVDVLVQMLVRRRWPAGRRL
ncbi:MAG: hypothetical protein ACYC1Z_08930 [Georgenia sp.]